MEPPKKKRHRACLDHLTSEQKQQRRKEKNRQAAQTARDRKRQNMDRLMAENEMLKLRLRQYEELFRLGQTSTQGPQQAPVTILDPTSAKMSHLAVPQVQAATDSGVSDVDSNSKMSSPNLAAENQMDYLTIPQSSSAATTTTPDSMFDGRYDHLSLSPASIDDDQLIDSFIGQENEQELTKEVQKVVNYIDNGVTSSDVPFGSAVSINVPPLQEQGTSSKSHHLTTVNSLGWTSIQLMLVILITRVHHLLSVRIGCCRKAQEVKRPYSNHSNNTDNQTLKDSQGTPHNLSIVDYILNTRCSKYCGAVEQITANKENITRQREIALDFVNKYLRMRVG